MRMSSAIRSHHGLGTLRNKPAMSNIKCAVVWWEDCPVVLYELPQA